MRRLKLSLVVAAAAVLPVAAWNLAHNPSGVQSDARLWLLVAAALTYSAPATAGWIGQFTGEGWAGCVKAWAFVALLEASLVFLPAPLAWLSWVCLGLLIALNALVMFERADAKLAAPLPSPTAPPVEKRETGVGKQRATVIPRKTVPEPNRPEWGPDTRAGLARYLALSYHAGEFIPASKAAPEAGVSLDRISSLWEFLQAAGIVRRTHPKAAPVHGLGSLEESVLAAVSAAGLENEWGALT
jgi:hypothetical protein